MEVFKFLNMRVGIDISSLNSMSKGRGIGFYTDYLIKSLKEYTNVDVEIIDGRQLTADSGKLDLIHYPFFDFFKPTLKVDPRIPTVVTIHDVIPLIFKSHYPPGIKGSINLFRQKQALKKVKAVITDSKTSTSDVQKVFGLKNNVFTVYLDSGDDFKQSKKNTEVREKYKLPEKYLLYSGSVNWNKNLLNQTKAAIEADMDVVYIGKGFENKDNLNHPEMRSFKKFLEIYSKHPKVHILGFVPAEDLIGLINQAQAVLYVSYYEGFGLPILEAQACGIPVITGNVSSMVEVAGDGALLVDPSDVEAIKEAILSLGNTQLVDVLVKKGRDNLKRFSWKKTAQETVKVYEYALAQKK